MESGVDEETSAALETADAIATAWGAGERQAAETAGDISRSASSRRVASRMAAAAADTWSAADDLASAAHDAV
jgi:hypothetical protein